MPEATTPTPPAAAAAPPPPADAPAKSEAAAPPPAAAPVESVIASAAKDEKAPDAKPADGTPAPIELKLPDGFDVDTAQLDTFKAKAVELGLDAPKAQAIFDQYVAIEQARTAAAEKAYVEQEQAWSAELKADPELGGDNWKGTIQHVRVAIGFLGKDAAALIDKTGLGSNPTLIRGLAKLGKALADDTIGGTAKAATEERQLSDAELLYGPTTDSKKEQ